MRNKLPILFALMLAVIVAAPYLRSHMDWCQVMPLLRQTTVPPPSSINLPAERRSPTLPAAEGQRNAPSENSPSSGSRPQSLVDYAVLAVEGQQFISAQVSEEGELLGHPFAGLGRYCEHRQGPIPQMQFSMTVQIDSVSTSLKQVCNGVTLWTYRNLPNGESLSKLDAVRAITALDQAAGHMPPSAMLTAPDWAVSAA